MPHVCHTSAYLATSGSVRRGPLPPIQIGGCGLLHRRRAELRVPQRHDPAVVGDDLAGEQPGHDLERVLEQVEALRRRRERDAELDVLLVEPCRAERSSSRPCDAWSMVSACAANTDGCR